MRNKLLACLPTLGLLLAAGSTVAAPAPDALLAALESASFSNRASAVANLAALPETELTALAKRVVPSATGGDNAIRTALAELAFHVNAPKREADRDKFAKALLAALAAATDDEVRAFLIERLRIVRSPAAVPALSAALASPALCDPAARALAAIGTPTARDALTARLNGASEPAALTLLNALAELPGVKPSLLLPWAGHGNREVRLCALHALAATSDPAAAPAVAAALKAPTAYERGLAAASCLDLARNLAAKKERRTAVSLCRSVMQAGQDLGEVQAFSSGLALLLDLDPKAGLSELTAALAHTNRVLRGQAILLARSSKDSDIDKALKSLTVSPDAAARADALEALAARGTLTLQTARYYLKDADESIRLAAARHLVRMDGKAAIETLLPLLVTPDRTAMGKILGDNLDARLMRDLAARLPDADPDAQARILDILGDRRASSTWDAVSAQCASTNETVSRAALKALGAMADASRMPALVERFIAAPEDRAADVGRALQAAVVGGAWTDDLLKMNGRIAGKRRLDWQDVLRRAGTDGAIATLVADTAATDKRVREKAVQALTKIDSKPALIALRKLAAESPDEGVKSTAEAFLKRADTNAPPPKVSAPKASAPAPAVVHVPGNLAAGRPVKTGVATQGPHAPEKTVDGDESINSCWWGARWPGDLTVDLGSVMEVGGTRTVFYYDDSRFYGWRIGVSEDGAKWTTVTDRADNREPVRTAGFVSEFPAAKARYVRLTITTNSANEAVHVVEFQVFAPGKIPSASAISAPAPSPVKSKPATSAAPAAPVKPQGPPDAEGFVPLFNGKDLSGWIGATNGYGAENGVLFCDPKSGGNLYTAGEYSDFILRFDFRLPPGANNGLGIRTAMQGDSAYQAMELQILDDTAPQYANLQPYQYHGSIYGVVPAKRGHQKPVGEWNTQEVRAVGSRITVILNGVTITDADLAEIKETMDHKPHPGLRRPSGHLGWLGHGARVEFRNIRIKDLSKNAP